jgi:hypothetical protein
MVPKYGLESVIYLKDGKTESKVVFYSRQQTIHPTIKEFLQNLADQQRVQELCTENGIRLFCEVQVSLQVVERGDQRRRIDVRLVSPLVDGFSIVTDCETELPS